MDKEMQSPIIGGNGGAGGSGMGSIEIVDGGVRYTEEQWWRRQMLERLDRIVELLEQGPTDPKFDKSAEQA